MKIFVVLAVLALADAQWMSGCGQSEYADAAEGQGFGTDPHPGVQIVNGVVARDRELPWQVSLEDNTGFHFCGGSILNERYVITAAHCTAGNSAGQINPITGKVLRTDAGTGRYNTQTIIDHENYSGFTLQNDISLLYTDSAMTIDSTAQPICAPPLASATYDGSGLTVSGWGTTSYGGPSAINLLYTNVIGISNTECSVNHYPGQITDDMICTHSSAGRDACQGDSGGPLVFKALSGRFELVGLVSWGSGCATNAGVYCRVTYMLDWIAANAN